MPRPRALKKPDTFEELNSIQNGWSTENEMADSERGDPVQKENKGSNISQNLGRAGEVNALLFPFFFFFSECSDLQTIK